MPQGQVTSVPADGLSTRQRRAQPLLAVHTGDGKGKSTAAFGMALRAWSAGWPIGVFQFTKSPKYKMGEGWSWLRTQPGDHERAARAGWEQVKRDLAAGTYRLLILDEFTYPVSSGALDVQDVLAALAARPGIQHVVITGRRAHPDLIGAADLVTDMTKVKHPMDAGRKGQAGIEW
jgi:cob(I)alamin adenosyltransferase